MKKFIVFLVSVYFVTTAQLFAQQVADTTGLPKIKNPAYRSETGPVVMIDEAHHNFHTAGGRYLPFATLLRMDGYRVEPFTTLFTAETLEQVDILVISNALHESNLNRWTLPTPSAFTDDEIASLKDWVERGGSLFLIADHMPMPGAAEKLAAAFGVKFNNGFAFAADENGGIIRRPVIFKRTDGTLASHPITNGRSVEERIDSVATFTGQAFQADDDSQALLTFGKSAISLMPETAWQFDENTKQVDIGGWLHGLVKQFSKGRVAIFGEAAMFTAQRQGQQGRSMGMNAPIASQNPQFLLNIMHWLSGIL